MLRPIQWIPVLLVVMGGCSSPPRNTGSSTVPADFGMVCGMGGGITGNWEGHTVRPDGSVFSWSGMKAEQDLKAAGTLTAEQKLSLWQKIDGMHFFDVKSDERGNMTSYLRVTANSRTHEVYWVPRQDLTDAAKPLQELYMLCEETVSHAAPSHE